MDQFHVSPYYSFYVVILLSCSLYSYYFMTVAATPNGFQPSNHQYPQASLSNS